MSLSASRVTHLRALPLRSYATSASGLSATARAKAEKLSADWKGTSATGGTTKNYIGGEFVESKTDKWIDLHDPVLNFDPLNCKTELMKLLSCSPLRPCSPRFRKLLVLSSSRQSMPPRMHIKLGVVPVS